MHDTVLLGATVCETTFWWVGIFSLIRREKATFAEATVYAIAVVLMAISFIHQLALMIGLFWVAPIMEAMITIGCTYAIIRNRYQLKDALKIVSWFIHRYPVIFGCFVLGWIVLGWQSLTTAFDEKTIHALSVFGSSEGIFTDVALPPLNAEVLPFHFLRVSASHGGGVIGFLAYLIICFSTYTLSRRYAWPPTALTVTAVVAGFSRLVYLARSSETEIVAAASGLFCILCIYKMLEQPDAHDMILFILGVCFCITGGPMGLLFPAMLVALAIILLYRRHGATTWPILLAQNRRTAIPALIPAAIFSQLWLVFLNHHHFGQWVPQGLRAYNPDGLQGGLANFFRYLLEMVSMPVEVDRFFKWISGLSPITILNGFHELLVFPIFGNQGAVTPFQVSWESGLPESWFGPLAAILVLPAVGYALLRGPRRIKALGIALTGYFYLSVLIFAWAPGNAGVFTRFFAGGGFFIAFLLPPWRLTQNGKRILQSLSLLLFVHALMT
jgi:hypothetical protein